MWFLTVNRKWNYFASCFCHPVCFNHRFNRIIFILLYSSSFGISWLLFYKLGIMEANCSHNDLPLGFLTLTPSPVSCFTGCWSLFAALTLCSQFEFSIAFVCITHALFTLIDKILSSTLTDILLLALFISTEPYTVREARFHVKRIKEILTSSDQNDAYAGTNNSSLSFVSGVWAGDGNNGRKARGTLGEGSIDCTPPEYIMPKSKDTPLLPLHPNFTDCKVKVNNRFL